MKKLLFTFFAISFIFVACKKEEGCTDPLATNYNAEAEDDDGSCQFGLVGGIWDVYYMETSLIINGDTLYFSSQFPTVGEISLQFMENGTLITNYDSSDWNISGDSLYFDMFDEGDAFKYTATRTELELRGFHPMFNPPADFIMRASR